MNDDFIKKKLRAKDKTAFESIFTYYYSGLCSFAFHLVGNRDAAEDLVQEFFARFWKKCDSYEITGTLKSFLFSSVHNASLDYLKHLKVVGAFEEHYRRAAQVSVEEHAFAREELEAIIQKALDQLAPRCREIFVLSRFEGCSNQEIADRLGISIRTVELQVSKALRALKEIL